MYARYSPRPSFCLFINRSRHVWKSFYWPVHMWTCPCFCEYSFFFLFFNKGGLERPTSGLITAFCIFRNHLHHSMWPDLYPRLWIDCPRASQQFHLKYDANLIRCCQHPANTLVVTMLCQDFILQWWSSIHLCSQTNDLGVLQIWGYNTPHCCTLSNLLLINYPFYTDRVSREKQGFVIYSGC